jgi:hypothetical protein
MTPAPAFAILVDANHAKERINARKTTGFI